MSLIDRFFPTKTVITSATIRAEIAKAEFEATTLRDKLTTARAGIAFMNDSEHQAAEQNIVATERAIKRLDARVAHLNDELPKVVAAEEAAAKAEADAALIKRAEDARKANEKDAAKHLAEFDKLASQIGDILSKLKCMDTDREAINTALRSNPVAEPVAGYHEIHRTTPGTQATEQHAKVPCWVYRYPGSPPDTDKVKFQYEAPREEVRPATIAPDGKPVPVATEIHNYYGREIVITPVLEMREVVVSRAQARPPRYEHPLDDVRLPPAFSGGQWAWPRS